MTLPAKILVPFDGREPSVAPLRFAVDLARVTGATVDAVRVATERHLSRIEAALGIGSREEALGFVARRAEAGFRRLGLPPALALRTVAGESVPETIRGLVQAEGHGLLALRPGGRNSSFRWDLPGSLTGLRPCDLLFVKGHTPVPWSGGGLVIAVDERPGSSRAVRKGLELCRRHGRRALLVHVLTDPEAPLPESIADLLASARASAEAAEVDCLVRTPRTPRVEDGLVSVAIRMNADLVVMRRCRTTVWGSAADRVVRESCYDVYLVGEET